MAQDDLYQPDQSEEQFLAKLQGASPYPFTPEQIEDWRQYYRTELNPPHEEEPEGFTNLVSYPSGRTVRKYYEYTDKAQNKFKLVRVEEL